MSIDESDSSDIKAAKKHAAESYCSICMTDDVFDDEWTKTDCGHTFHKSCISKWEYNKCPNCTQAMDASKSITKPTSDDSDLTVQAIMAIMGGGGLIYSNLVRHGVVRVSEEDANRMFGFFVGGNVNVEEKEDSDSDSEEEESNGRDVQCGECHRLEEHVTVCCNRVLCSRCITGHVCPNNSFEDGNCSFCGVSGMHRVCSDGCNDMPWCRDCYDTHSCDA